MISVYVKHYLNKSGRDYFDKVWFPYVCSIITKQEGFVSIETSRDEIPECVNIIVKFTNAKTLDAWVKNSLHTKVVNDLDIYRTQGQRWFVSEDNAPAPALEEWDQAIFD